MNKNQTKKIITVFAVSVLALFAGGSYASADFSAVNLRTGFDSDSDVDFVADMDYSFDSVNVDLLDNFFEGYGDTGFNLGDGDIDTGDVEAVVLGGNADNRNVLDVDDLGDLDGDIVALNDTTGALSDNDASVLVDQDVDVDNDNDADVDNDLSLAGNTGYNESEGWDGEIETGDAEAQLTVENALNRNFVALETGLEDVDAEIGNTCTGFDSDNDASLTIADSTDIDNDNDADVDNSIAVLMNTGFNEVEGIGGCCCGTGCGLNVCGDCEDESGVETGDAEVEVAVKNTVNANQVDIDGGMDVDVEAVNSATGCDSDNDTDVAIASDLDLDNSNDADIDNNVGVAVNTGNNLSDSGWFGGEIETGDAEAEVRIENVANVNDVDLDMGGDIDVEAGNSCTGEDSDNDTDVAISRTVDVDNTNRADIDNNVSISANTGGNVSGTCGGGNCGSEGGISTGDSVIRFGVINNANANSF